MDSKKQTKWLDRYLVSHPDHVNELEQKAALHEFDSKMPRHLAEEKAYGDYRKEQHGRAAAHHLRGLKAAQGSGDTEEARKHGAMYELHAKQLGFDPWGEAPAELNQYMHEEKPEPAHRFKAHRGDLLVLDKHREDVKKAEVQATLARILRKAELVSLLKYEPRTEKVYECQGCGHESLQVTNHHGSFHASCPNCSWKGVKIGKEHHEPGPREHKYVGEKPLHGPGKVHTGGGEKTAPKTGHLKVVKGEELSKGDVLKFPSDRVTPAADQGKPASIAGVLGRVMGNRYEPYIPPWGVGTKGVELKRPEAKKPEQPIYKPGDVVQTLGDEGYVGIIHAVHPRQNPNHQHRYTVIRHPSPRPGGPQVFDEKWMEPLGKSDGLSKGAVIPFPKDRVTPAVDQGKPAQVSEIRGVKPPLYKTGHRVKYNQDTPDSGNQGTVHRVHPAVQGTERDQSHMYYVKWDDGNSGTYYEDQLLPHKP